MSPQHPSIVSALESFALTDPNKPAFIFVNETLDRLVLTRREVWDYSRKYAAMLRKVGLNKGDVVCNTLPNSPQRLISMFGTITAGCITMSAQTVMADGSDLVFSLTKGKAKAIVADETRQTFTTLKQRLDKFEPGSNEISCPDVSSLKFAITHTLGNWKLFLENIREEPMLSEGMTSESICVYMSTSGSEGVVKLAPYNSNVLLEVGNVAFSEYKDKTYMCDLDLGWISGFPHAYLTIGTTRVLLDKGCAIPENSASLQWTVIAKEKCDFCFTVPSYLLEFPQVRGENKNEEIGNYKLKTVIAGGGSVTRKHVQASAGEIADVVVIFYGSTETGLSASSAISSVDEYEDLKIGWPTNNTKFKVVDKHDKELPTGHIGEILIQCNQSLLHYVDDPEKSSKTFHSDGWIRLGDIGKVNRKGQLFLMGRKKFAISKGNIVYYPEVVERFVRKCPGVKDVAIVGVPDEKLYEEICALIIKDPSADISEKDVRFFCEESVTHNSVLVPKYILFVDKFIYTSRQKLNRNAIKKLARDMLFL